MNCHITLPGGYSCPAPSLSDPPLFCKEALVSSSFAEMKRGNILLFSIKPGTERHLIIMHDGFGKKRLNVP